MIRKVNDMVLLKHSNAHLLNMGCLNSDFMYREGYKDQPVPIVEINGKDMTVELPSGYKLRITEKDICR